MHRLFVLPAQAVASDWVTVGDPGNACDPQPQGCSGAVAHAYLLAAWGSDSTDPFYSNSIIGLRVASVPTGWVPDCSDGMDNDADGFTDYLDDPGCTNHDDGSERSPDLVCDDGENNDGDAFIDYPSDPGCFSPTSGIEDPKCQDAKDNDGDGTFDFDGGLSTLGYVATAPDPQCSYAWQMREARSACGLGAELALLLPPLMWPNRRRSRVGGQRWGIERERTSFRYDAGGVYDEPDAEATSTNARGLLSHHSDGGDGSEGFGRDHRFLLRSIRCRSGQSHYQLLVLGRRRRLDIR